MICACGHVIMLRLHYYYTLGLKAANDYAVLRLVGIKQVTPVEQWIEDFISCDSKFLDS